MPIAFRNGDRSSQGHGSCTCDTGRRCQRTLCWTWISLSLDLSLALSLSLSLSLSLCLCLVLCLSLCLCLSGAPLAVFKMTRGASATLPVRSKRSSTSKRKMHWREGGSQRPIDTGAAGAQRQRDSSAAADLRKDGHQNQLDKLIHKSF